MTTYHSDAAADVPADLPHEFHDQTHDYAAMFQALPRGEDWFTSNELAAAHDERDWRWDPGAVASAIYVSAYRYIERRRVSAERRRHADRARWEYRRRPTALPPGAGIPPGERASRRPASGEENGSCLRDGGIAMDVATARYAVDLLSGAIDSIEERLSAGHVRPLDEFSARELSAALSRALERAG